MASWLLFTGACAGEFTNEYQVKAAYIFKFAKFIEWPAHKFAQPDSPFIIGIFGSDPFQGLLEEAVQDQRIREHLVIVKRISNINEARRCHLLFVSRSEAGRAGNIISDVHGDNVLTVGETDRFTQRGGVINFVNLEDKVHFEINASAARRAGLKIPSQLLQLGVPPAPR